MEGLFVFALAALFLGGCFWWSWYADARRDKPRMPDGTVNEAEWFAIKLKWFLGCTAFCVVMLLWHRSCELFERHGLID
jgi:hypothetical protein